MNFQKISPIETGDEMLDFAFRKARQHGKSKKLKGNWLEIVRKKECLKIDLVATILVERILKIKNSFPLSRDLSVFYQKLMDLTLDVPYYQKSLGSLAWAVKRIKSFQSQSCKAVIKTKERGDIKEVSKQFYGRVSSIVNQVGKYLVHLEAARKTMQTYPDVKDLFTVCIYGFPNVGKTTFLNKITGTKAETAAYAFTTRTINAGYFTSNGHKIQVFDVPGTLARGTKRNDIEKQADLVLDELADAVIYVFDLSETSGYSFKKQEELYQRVAKKNVFVYLSKTDLFDLESVDFAHNHFELKDLKKQVGLLVK